MCDQCNAALATFACDVCSDEAAIVPAAAPSRRAFLKSGAGLVAGGAAAQMLPERALAQGSGPVDAELARLQGQRRILLKGGVVLTLDRQLGDFARGDVLIEDGRIREVRPNIEVSGDAAAVVDASNRILIPGFVDTHSHSYQGLLRGILTSGVLEPDYNRDVQKLLSPAFRPEEVYAGVLVTMLAFIDMGTTSVVDISQISHSPEHSDACIRALKSRESGRSTPIPAVPHLLRNIRRTSNDCSGPISARRTSY